MFVQCIPFMLYDINYAEFTGRNLCIPYVPMLYDVNCTGFTVMYLYNLYALSFYYILYDINYAWLTVWDLCMPCTQSYRPRMCETISRVIEMLTI